MAPFSESAQQIIAERVNKGESVSSVWRQATEELRREAATIVPSTPTLLGLPPELRLQMWELAVYHEETDGVISPIPKEAQTFPWGMIILKGGTRSIVGTDVNRVTRAWNMGEIVRAFIMRALKSLRERGFAYMWNELLSFPTRHHVCTTDCLLQPAISRVSPKIRAETLKAFYSSNKIHIEMGNFDSVRISPREWWRAIEDTNLRFIKSLNLFVGNYYTGVMIKYRKGQTGQKLTRTIRNGFIKNEGRIRQVLRVVEVDGLHVQALEDMLGLLTR